MDTNTSFHRTASSGTNESESERLSQDLAIFLSNPALSSKLTDGSLNLASYSSTINSELAVLEKECIQLHRNAEDDVKVLRDEMGVCDEILAGLQEMLLVSLFRYDVLLLAQNNIHMNHIMLFAGVSSRSIRPQWRHSSTPRPITLSSHSSAQPPPSGGRSTSLPRTYRRTPEPRRDHISGSYR